MGDVPPSTIRPCVDCHSDVIRCTTLSHTETECHFNGLEPPKTKSTPTPRNTVVCVVGDFRSLLTECSPSGITLNGLVPAVSHCGGVSALKWENCPNVNSNAGVNTTRLVNRTP